MSFLRPELKRYGIHVLHMRSSKCSSLQVRIVGFHVPGKKRKEVVWRWRLECRLQTLGTRFWPPIPRYRRENRIGASDGRIVFVCYAGHGCRNVCVVMSGWEDSRPAGTVVGLSRGSRFPGDRELAETAGTMQVAQCDWPTAHRSSTWDLLA